MKRDNIVILSSLIIISSANAATVHDNCLYSNAITGFELNSPTSYSITSGQPFIGVSVIANFENTCLDVQAGRKKSSSNMKWVKNGMESAGITWSYEYMVPTIDNGTHTPNKLNFAILGTLSLVINGNPYTCANVYIGQGTPGIFEEEDWWVFNNNYKINQSLLCKDSLMNDVFIYPTQAVESGELKSNTIYFYLENFN